jgi:hypothetical protein
LEESIRKYQQGPATDWLYDVSQVQRIPENVLAAITYDVLQGLAILHRKRMVSRADNIMVVHIPLSLSVTFAKPAPSAGKHLI